MNSFGLPRTEVFALIVNSGLLPLCNMCYEVADKGLMCAFVERWHRDTNTFHMPFGEITITLDDVSSLLNLPIPCAPVVLSDLIITTTNPSLKATLRTHSSNSSRLPNTCTIYHIRM